jgi:ribulose kinase
VLLGAAILGAVATKKYNSLREAMKALNAAGQVWTPFFPSIFIYTSYKNKLFYD